MKDWIPLLHSSHTCTTEAATKKDSNLQQSTMFFSWHFGVCYSKLLEFPGVPHAVSNKMKGSRQNYVFLLDILGSASRNGWSSLGCSTEPATKNELKQSIKQILQVFLDGWVCGDGGVGDVCVTPNGYSWWKWMKKMTLWLNRFCASLVETRHRHRALGLQCHGRHQPLPPWHLAPSPGKAAILQNTQRILLLPNTAI